MGMQSNQSGELSSEINVTPFVDVLLVLLIIFMVAAPMITKAVDVDLPQAEGGALDDKTPKLILGIGKDRGLSIAGTAVRWRELETKLSSNEKLKQDQVLWVEADKSLPYDVVVTAMAIAKKAGVAKVQLLT